MRAGLANDFTAEHTSEVALDQIGPLGGELKPVHQKIAKFVDVHLLKDIDWVAIEVLECVAESLGVVVLLLRVLQCQKETLSNYYTPT